LSNNIIQKGLAFARDWSGTVAHSGSEDALRSCPAGSVADAGLRWCGAAPLSTERRISKCQRLRRNHHLLRLFPSLPKAPHGRLVTIPRAGAPIRAPSNPASSRCCNHRKEQQLRLWWRPPIGNSTRCAVSLPRACLAALGSQLFSLKRQILDFDRQ